eukprot:scpid12978/ scgid14000/ 
MYSLRLHPGVARIPVNVKPGLEQCIRGTTIAIPHQCMATRCLMHAVVNRDASEVAVCYVPQQEYLWIVAAPLHTLNSELNEKTHSCSSTNTSHVIQLTKFEKNSSLSHSRL